MNLRRYRSEDLPALSRLFGETVRRVNIRDYTPAQVEAWSAGQADLLARDGWFRRLHTLVAETDGRIAGYGNVDGTGYLDHLFVRWDYQGRGVATAICDALEQHCRDLGLDAVTVLSGGTGTAGATTGAGADKLRHAQGIAQIENARKIRNEEFGISASGTAG